MERLSTQTQLLYSELFQQGLRGLPLDKGSFVTKIINNKKYWYFQISIGSKKMQHSLGPDSEEVREKIKQEVELKKQEQSAIKNREELVSMLTRSQAVSINGEDGAVFSLLERSGLFLTGAALIGSHAFGVYSNMLGVKWKSELFRTTDIDICENKSISIGLIPKEINLKKEIINSNMGFFEVPALNNKQTSTSFKIRGSLLEVDILTPLIGKPSSSPVYIPSLKTYAEPVRYLDYLLKDIQPAVLIFGRGILVNVPSPAYYAIHKVVVSCCRPVAFQTKSLKDISQAEQLLDVLMTDRPGDIEIALEDIQSMPGKFGKLFFEGVAKLSDNIKKKLCQFDNYPTMEQEPTKKLKH